MLNMKIVITSLMVAALVVAGGWYWHTTQPVKYVTPGGINLLKVPKGFLVTADTLTWDTQTQPKGERITLQKTSGSLTLPYIIINLGPKTQEITADSYINNVIEEINQAGGKVLLKEPFDSGYRLEVTALEEGVSVRGYIVALDKEDMTYQITAVARETEWLEDQQTFDRAIDSLILTRD